MGVVTFVKNQGQCGSWRAFPTRQDLGTYWDMAQGHLMTIEVQDEDLIRSQALRMNMHEVPS